MRQNLLSTSLEAVQYQGKSLFLQDLTLAIQRMKDENDITTHHLEAVGVDKIVFKYTGLNTKTEIAKEGEMMFNACAYPPIIDGNTPFFNLHNDAGYNDFIESEKLGERKLRSFSEDLRATVDRKKGRVGGLFSKIPLKMFLGYQLVRELPAEQTAAVYMHEIGHLFTFFEILVDTVATNLAISAASEALGKSESAVQRLEIIHAYERVAGRSLTDAKALAESKLNTQAYQAVLIREYVGEPARSGNNSRTYDFRGSEFAADHYATMQGAGKDLVAGLDAIYTKFGINTRQSFGTWFLIQALGAAAVIFVAATNIMNPVTLLQTFAMWAALIGLMLNPYMEHNLYDEPKARALRVRNNLVQALKDLKLNPKERADLLDNIEFIDEITADMADRRNLLQMIWVTLTPARRRQYSQIKFQKELEDMINNNLFVSAGKLNQMTAQGA